MFRNYFKTAWRNLWRSKLYSFINVIGLAIGITCCVLIFLYVQYETSYDAYNQKGDRLYRLTTQTYEPSGIKQFAPTSPVTSQSLKNNFPGVENFVRINYSRRPLSYKDKKFFDITVLYADSTMFDVFTMPLVSGDPKKALTAPYSIVLTESAAKRYFGKEAAYGRMVKMSDTVNLMVTGIMKDVPANSHFNFDALLSRSTMSDMNKNSADWNQNNEKNWFNCNSYAYLLLRKGVSAKDLEPKFNSYLEKQMADIRKATGMRMHVKLQLVKDIHLKSHLDAEFGSGSVNSDITYIYIFSGTALLILLIACCNFINLSTARSINRSKEIGLRKVIGARRVQLVTQFLGESVLFSVMASLLSVLLVVCALPLFNNFVHLPLKLNLNVFWMYLAIIACVGFLAGLYPALLMSSFTPIRSLKGKVSHGWTDVLFRKGLVVFQFSIAVVLIIGTTLILEQLNFIQNRNIGMNKEQLLAIELKGPVAAKKEVMLKEMLKNPHVVSGTLTDFSFKRMSNITLLPEGKSEQELTSCPVFSADEGFLSTFQIPLAAGRGFSKDYPSDVDDAFMVNEAAVKAFGWKTPKEAIGKKVQWGMGKDGKIIGVVKDFNFASLRENIEPVLFNIYPQWFSTLTLRLKAGDMAATMRDLERNWKSLSPGSPFKYSFMEDDFNSLYQSEQNMRAVLSFFTFLSVFVACLGLFGLASFTIRQRFREIGIRKVLGSSVGNIVQLLSKDFLKLVVLAIVIGSPLAWYVAHSWLQDFAYKVNIGWWIFAVAAMMALLVAFVTVSVQAVRAAMANPIKSLRTE